MKCFWLCAKENGTERRLIQAKVEDVRPEGQPPSARWFDAIQEIMGSGLRRMCSYRANHREQ